MPEPDGYAVARELRQHEDLASLEIVMLTSCGLAPDARRRRRLGIADWLAKPVKERDLLDVLDRVLSRAAEAPLASAVWEPAAEAGDDGLRILLVEDSVPNQLVALTMLRHHGHDVTVASDGQEAIGLFGSHEFDVVLMDVQMPLMDGFACTRAIRSAEAASGRVRHVPIIAMTAHALQGDRERCLEAGMDDYVSKPIRREQLLEALDRVQAHR
jgi:CheY-like chemotaxis protein